MGTTKYRPLGGFTCASITVKAIKFSLCIDKIPENHILKKITTVIDFSFIAKKSARRLLVIGVNTAEFYEISQYQKSEAYSS